MSEKSIWIGCDPGGKNSFGIAVIDSNRGITTKTVGFVQEAREVILDACRGEEKHVKGLGVDAPLWWSSGPSADRRADQRIRNKYRPIGVKPGSVQAVNSLRGAAIAQGLLIVAELRKEFPVLKVTESNPKVQIQILGDGKVQRYFSAIDPEYKVASEHERDALVAAIAAREGFSNRWRVDLAKDRYEFEQDPESHWVGPVHYFWHEEI
jgi:predicted nuclease with RNAse H fold